MAKIETNDDREIDARATDADLIEKVRAASSIACLERQNDLSVRCKATEDLPAGATAVAKIDILICVRLKNPCRRSR